jgi:hypothetical protein
MPSYFKALTTITAWGIWIFAWVIGISSAVMGIVNGDLYGSGDLPMTYPAMFAVAIAAAVLAVVVMLLRKKMEK